MTRQGIYNVENIVYWIFGSFHFHCTTNARIIETAHVYILKSVGWRGILVAQCDRSCFKKLIRRDNSVDMLTNNIP